MQKIGKDKDFFEFLILNEISDAFLGVG